MLDPPPLSTSRAAPFLNPRIDLPPVGAIFIEAGSAASRWRLREIWRNVCVLESVSEPNRWRYLYLADLLKTNRYGMEPAAQAPAAARYSPPTGV